MDYRHSRFTPTPQPYQPQMMGRVHPVPLPRQGGVPQQVPVMMLPNTHYTYPSAVGPQGNRLYEVRDSRSFDGTGTGIQGSQRNVQQWLSSNWSVPYMQDSVNYQRIEPYSTVPGGAGYRVGQSMGMQAQNAYAGHGDRHASQPKVYTTGSMMPQNKSRLQMANSFPRVYVTEKKEFSDGSSTTHTELISRSPQNMGAGDLPFPPPMNEEKHSEKSKSRSEPGDRGHLGSVNEMDVPPISFPISTKTAKEKAAGNMKVTGQTSKQEDRKITPRKKVDTPEQEKPLIYSSENNFRLETMKEGSFVDVLIHPCFLTTFNENVINCTLWGTDVYSTSSDIVAILVHTGKLKISHKQPQRALRISLEVMSSPRQFISSQKYGIESRSGLRSFQNPKAIKIHSIQEDDGQDIKANSSLLKRSNVDNEKSKLIASETTFTFGSDNTPCYSFSLEAIGDRGFSARSLCSAKLRMHVLILETDDRIVELRRDADFYSLCDVSQLYIRCAHSTFPVPDEYKREILTGFPWDDIEVNTEFVKVRGMILFPRAFSWRIRSDNDI